MIAHGRVYNGVVVLEEGVRFPEGQEVTVFAPGQSPVGGPPSQPRGVLDIPPVSVASTLRPLGPNDDLLGEMLEGRS